MHCGSYQVSAPALWNMPPCSGKYMRKRVAVVAMIVMPMYTRPTSERTASDEKKAALVMSEPSAAGADHARDDAERRARDGGHDAVGEALGHLHADREEDEEEHDEAEGARVGDAVVAVAPRRGRLGEHGGLEAGEARVE